jgi:hypothetical protein
MPGLDPGIHSLQENGHLFDGLPGHLARRRAEPVIGRRFCADPLALLPGNDEITTTVESAHAT